jgi:cytochrome b561
MKNPSSYSRTQIWLHWIVAGLIAGQYLFKDAISKAYDAFVNGTQVAFDPLVLAHVAGGTLILGLMVWRLALRTTRGVPQPPKEEARALKFLAHVAHWSFYAVVAAMALSGLAAWFGEIETAAGVHSILKIALLALIALHVIAALFHQFVLKTNILRRMSRSQG